MTQVRIVTDSGADLPASLASQQGIVVVPLIVRFGEQVYLDGQLSPGEFWERAATSPHHPATSQPAVGVFEEAFAHLVGAGHAVLCLTITGKHSGTFSSASAAARQFGNHVKVMDTLSLSLGQGFQVLAAAHAAARGLHLDEIVRLVERVRERTHLFILLDTIEYIRRGGRADALLPVLDRVSRMLRIKPILRVVEGQLTLHALSRSYERGLARIARDVSYLRPVESAAVIHVRCPDVAERMVRTLAEKLDLSPDDVVLAETGAALAAHGGPKVIGAVVVQRNVRALQLCRPLEAAARAARVHGLQRGQHLLEKHADGDHHKVDVTPSRGKIATRQRARNDQTDQVIPQGRLHAQEQRVERLVGVGVRRWMWSTVLHRTFSSLPDFTHLLRPPLWST